MRSQLTLAQQLFILLTGLWVLAEVMKSSSHPLLSSLQHWLQSIAEPVQSLLIRALTHS